MSAFPKFHGITLANNSFIENAVLESFATDPVVTGAGRVWYNSVDKLFKCSTLNAGGAVVTRAFATKEEFDAFVSNLLSTDATKGTNLVGFEGHAGANSKFSVAASSLKSSLDSIIDKIDSNSQSIVDIGSGNLVNMQNEIDATQAGAGLSAAGAYVATSGANYIASVTTLNGADVALDTALKAEADARSTAVTTLTNNLATEVTNRTNADTSIQNELDATQAGAGLSAAGAYVATGAANYIASATTLNGADVALDTALKAEADARSTADTTLTNNLATEVTNRTNADTTLTNNLATEVTNRTNADTAIRTDFASTANAKGASLVGIEDVAGLLTATTVEAALAELHGDITSLSGAVNFQQVYDNSTAVGGEVVVTLAADKTLKFKDNNDATYFSLDPDGSNPVKVSMSGPINVTGDMSISGNLTVTGATTEITSTINNADHWAILPAGAPAALIIEPATAFTGDTVVDIKSQNGGASVLNINKTNATVAVTKLTSSVSLVANGTTTLNGTLAVNEDVTVAAATALNFGSNKLTKVADGVAVDDAATVGQVATAVTNANTGLSTEITNRTNADTAIQNELDATQAGAGLSAAGAYVATGAANYIASATTLNGADVALDTALKAEADARSTAVTTLTNNLATEVTNRTNADTAIQNELDATQTGAGLSAAGAYVVNGSANYISAVTTLNGADVALDTALKAEVDARTLAGTTAATNLSTEITNRTNADTAIQNELDATQAGAGLSAAGAYVANGSANYIASATTLNGADVALDTALKAISNELDATQVGAGLSAAGAYVANGSANYISAVTTLNGADVALDTALKTEETNRISAVTTVANNLSTEATSRANADTQIRTDVNAQLFTFEAATAALTHSVAHNLNASFVNYTVLVMGTDNLYRNDIVAITETDANTLTVELTEARKVKVAVRKAANI